MSYEISVYGDKAFKIILLPAVNNADYKEILYKDTFGLKEDVVLGMEIVNYKWSFKKSNSYTLTKGGSSFWERPIADNDIIHLETSKGEKLTILSHQLESPFEVYKKFCLHNLKKVTIGKTAGNDIQYDYFGLVSQQHAVLELSQEGCSIRDLSANGTFVNNIRVNHIQKLKFGDTIHILGLQMVYLGNIIAVKQSAAMRINMAGLHELSPDQLQGLCSNIQKQEGTEDYYHRTPRNIEKFDDTPIEIDPPPAPVQQRKQSMVTSVGPAFTMAFPMLMGSLLSIYGSGNSSVFMYTGLVTAVSSAFIGSIWATVNVKKARKDAARDEAERQAAYVDYLKKMNFLTKEEYERNTAILHNRYPSAETCAGYSRHTPGLWNRNSHHSDFLYHRVGLGRIPFQASITVPKEQFRVKKDDLALKPKDIKTAYETLKDVPVGINFLEHLLIGIVGGKDKAGALELARNLLIQIAANNCYTDVKIAVVYNREKGYEASCLKHVKWLPHVWSEDKKSRYVADTPSEAVDVFYEIAKVLRSREEEKSKEKIPKPYYILFLTDSRCLEGEAIAKYIFSNNKNYGISTVFLADNYEDLPNSCEFIVQNNSEFQGYYNVSDSTADRVPVQFDNTKPENLEYFARRISNIEVNEIEKGGEIPNSLTFFEMMGIQNLEQMDVLSRWRKNRTYDSMKALVGQKSGGAPCYLDIHEKYHGPHGLVAGTTGSGKSETLQTYILSMAINYSPDDVGFFVIDYKGGGMANLFSELPHTIGQISNLSGNQVHRAMVSIKSENRRRQSIFNEYGVNNINNYTRLYKNNEAKTPIPHLFIIIDEFAELKREESDFMRELISVAQVGRSLGVHLILATQKPSGTVDDNIWSNAKFRLCLRVQDKQDSNDMLHKPDAAFITQAGRCYLQVGNDEIYELFQSGWSGAVYDDMENSGKTEIAKMLSISGKAALVGNRLKINKKEQQKKAWIASLVETIEETARKTLMPTNVILEDTGLLEGFEQQLFNELEKRHIDYPINEYNQRRMEELLQLYVQAKQKNAISLDQKVKYILAQVIVQGKKIPEMKEKTQLDAVVEYLSVLAKENGYTNKFSLWLPVLPTQLYLKELKGYASNCFDGNAWPKQKGPWKLEAYIGMLDDPVNQSQKPLLVNLSEGGHHAVCGTVVSGKSTFLQSLVYSFAHSYSPEYINFYLLDFSSRMLGAFEGMPHVGGIVYENEPDKIGKFFNMINEIMEDRKLLLKGGNYEQYVRVNGVVIPAIIIVIDQFSNFREKTEGVYEEALIQLSRNGAGYGIYLILSSAGFGMTEIPGRIGDNLRTVVSLELSDKYQYTEVFHTLHIGVYPESGVKGRGLVNRNGNILEFQTALCVEAKDDYTRSEKIAEECESMRKAWYGRRARQIPEIPAEPILSDFAELDSVEQQLSDDRHLPLGYNQDNASIYSIDLRSIFCWVIQGKTHTGKTNTLKVLMYMASKKMGEVAVIDYKGALKPAADKIGAKCLESDQEVVEYWKNLLPVIQHRNVLKRGLVAEGLDEEEIYERMSDEKKYYLFIDDLTEFVNHIYHPATPQENIQGFLENITEKGKLFRIYIFACFNQDKAAECAGYKVYENIIRYKTGIHLGGNTASQNIMDYGYIPFTESLKVQKPGIGLLPAINGEAAVKSVVIPLDRRKS